MVDLWCVLLGGCFGWGWDLEFTCGCAFCFLLCMCFKVGGWVCVTLWFVDGWVCWVGWLGFCVWGLFGVSFVCYVAWLDFGGFYWFVCLLLLGVWLEGFVCGCLVGVDDVDCCVGF